MPLRIHLSFRQTKLLFLRETLHQNSNSCDLKVELNRLNISQTYHFVKPSICRCGQVVTVISVGMTVTSILMVLKFSETNRRMMIKNEKYTYLHLGATH